MIKLFVSKAKSFRETKKSLSFLSLFVGVINESAEIEEMNEEKSLFAFSEIGLIGGSRRFT